MKKKQRAKLKHFTLAMVIMANDHIDQRDALMDKIRDYLIKEDISELEFNKIMPELEKEVVEQEMKKQ